MIYEAQGESSSNDLATYDVPAGGGAGNGTAPEIYGIPTGQQGSDGNAPTFQFGEGGPGGESSPDGPVIYEAQGESSSNDLATYDVPAGGGAGNGTAPTFQFGEGRPGGESLSDDFVFSTPVSRAGVDPLNSGSELNIPGQVSEARKSPDSGLGTPSNSPSPTAFARLMGNNAEQGVTI